MSSTPTPNYGWPRPDKDGIQRQEIDQIANALGQVDTELHRVDVGLAALLASFTTHSHSFAEITGKPTTVAGYGITDAYTKTGADAAIAQARTALKGEILGGADPAFDTLRELQTALGSDGNVAATLTAAIATKWGPIGASFRDADIYLGVKQASLPGKNRLVLNDKADGSGADVITFNEDGSAAFSGDVNFNGGNAFLRGTAAQFRIQPTSGNGHVYWMSADGSAIRAVIYTSGGAQGALYFQVGSVGYYMDQNGHFQAPQNIYAGAGAAYLQANGNVWGPVWAQLGSPDAYTAIVNRIESRAYALGDARGLAWANDRVANLQYRRVSRGNIAPPVGSSSDVNAPAGAVLTGIHSTLIAPGNRQLDNLYYMYLQVYDPVRGWVGFQG